MTLKKYVFIAYVYARYTNMWVERTEKDEQDAERKRNVCIDSHDTWASVVFVLKCVSPHMLLANDVVGKLFNFSGSFFRFLPLLFFFGNLLIFCHFLNFFRPFLSFSLVPIGTE